MEHARERRRKLEQKKRDKKEEKKHKKRLDVAAHRKLNQSIEETGQQWASTKKDVLALAKELRSRSSRSTTTQNEKMVMTKLLDGTPDEQLFVADFDPKHFASGEKDGDGGVAAVGSAVDFDALLAENERKDKTLEARDEPLVESHVRSIEERLKKEHQSSLFSTENPQKQAANPSAAAEALLARLQRQRHATELRLKISRVSKHQTNVAEFDPHQMERKATSLRELSMMVPPKTTTPPPPPMPTDEYIPKPIARKNSIEASIVEKFVEAAGSHDQIESGLEQHESYLASLASLSEVTASDIESAAGAKNVQLTAQEIEYILEDVLMANSTTDSVVDSIKDEINSKSSRNHSKLRKAQTDYHRALLEHQNQISEQELCAITEEDGEDDGSNLLGLADESKLSNSKRSSSDKKKKKKGKRTSATGSAGKNAKEGNNPDAAAAFENPSMSGDSSAMSVEDSILKNFTSTSTSTGASDSSSEVDDQEVEGMVSFESGMSNSTKLLEDLDEDEMSLLGSISGLNEGAAPACCFWSKWFSNSCTSSSKNRVNASDASDALVIQNDMSCSRSRGSFESAGITIDRVTSSQSYDEDDLLDHLENGLCCSSNNRR